MVRKQVEDIIRAVLGGDSSADFVVERSDRPEYGDYSTNIALRGGDVARAEEIAQKISENELVEKAEVKNGFINIFLVPDIWYGELDKILSQRQDYGLLTLGGESTVNVEFISANPTGELHVGNGRGVFFGDVLSNLLEKAGYNVKREYLVNNARASAQIKELGATALGRGDAYKGEYLDKIVAELSAPLSEKKDNGEAGHFVAQRVLKDIKKLVEGKMGVQVDRWFSEDELFASGQIEAALEKLPTYKKEGAVWARTTDYGDEEDRVLIRSNNTPGYFLSDIAYHIDKIGRADLVVEIWGADHQGHVKRMMAMMEHLGLKDRVQILITQIVRVKEKGRDKKMSKRLGDTITLEWLIDEVGQDVARFFYLSKSLNTHMDFDLVLAKEQSKKNPAYYVQYSYARSHQIFAKAEGASGEGANLSLLKDSSELILIKKLAEYPELIERIVLGYATSKSYDLHKITTYATELSASFHRFYESNKVLVDEEDIKQARLALVKGFQMVLGDVLRLLGVSAPEKM